MFWSLMVKRGWDFVFKGARRGSPGLTGLGTAMLGLALIKRLSRGRELLWSSTLKPGRGVRVRLLGPEGSEELEIVEPEATVVDEEPAADISDDAV